MTHRGFSAWCIQTGPFAACWVDFVPNFFHLYTVSPIINQMCKLLLSRREVGRKGEKGIHQNWMKHRGFSAWGIQNGPYASCWVDFVPTLSHHSTLPPLINHKCQFLLPQRGRQKIRKGNSPKLDDTQGFQCLGHSKWTICILLSWFCPHIVSPFYVASTNKP